MNLQDVVDDLAQSLGRSVVINDMTYRPLAASAQGDEIDEARTRSLLQRQTPAAERAYLESLRVIYQRSPVTVDLEQFGARQRMAIPVWADDTPVAVLWLILGGLPPLTERHFRAIDAAVETTRHLLTERIFPAGGIHQGRALPALLSASPFERRRALVGAYRSLSLTPGQQLSVRAVTAESDTGVVHRAALGRALEDRSRRQLRYIGEFAHALVFLDDGRSSGLSDDDIRSTAARVEVAMRSVGASPIGSDENDILPAVERAVAAANVIEVVPELGGDAPSSPLGPWLLLADVLTEPARLAWYSPAAYSLLSDPDPLRRETVEAYLDVAGNVRIACERLHVHRTTLYYRLENLPQIVKDALDDGLSRSTLHIGLKLCHYWRRAGVLR